MAKRPVFVVVDEAPFWREEIIEFPWSSGLSKTQKQKNIEAIHKAYKEHHPVKEVLEISSKSMQEAGVELSAFNLKKYVQTLDERVPVECIYQGSKVFLLDGPFKDLYTVSPKKAKTDERLKKSGRLIEYTYEDENFPIDPLNAFYNYIYILALKENPDLAEHIIKYDAFTDIEYNSASGSINCQARAAAQYCALVRLGLIDKMPSFDEYLDLIKQEDTTGSAIQKFKRDRTNDNNAPYKKGEIIIHRRSGLGTITEIKERVVIIDFPDYGSKKLDLKWCMNHCMKSEQCW